MFHMSLAGQATMGVQASNQNMQIAKRGKIQHAAVHMSTSDRYKVINNFSQCLKKSRLEIPHGFFESIP